MLGLTLPGASSIPAVDADAPPDGLDAGRRIVEMVWEDLRPRASSRRQRFRNAVVADMAISGSTNSLIHLIAMARRFGLELSLDDFAEASERVPVICNLSRAGQYLMEDFYYRRRAAGGAEASSRRISTCRA